MTNGAEIDLPSAHLLDLSQKHWEYKHISKPVGEVLMDTTSQKVCPEDDFCAEADRLQSENRPLKQDSKEGKEGSSGQECKGGGRKREMRLHTYMTKVNCMKRTKLSSSCGNVCSTSNVMAEPRMTFSSTTSLNILRAEAEGEVEDKKHDGVWDIFVLILQTSGLQHISSRAGYGLDLTTLMIADPTSSFMRVTLWRRAAQLGAKIIRAGDLVRLNRVSVSVFRGMVQASSTPESCFRVVWRNDTFTTPQDAHEMTMLSSTSVAPDNGGRREPGGRIGQAEDLAVPRMVACDLASWAKRDFPSVTTAMFESGEISGGSNLRRSHFSTCVRRGVETEVEACVLEVSGVERIWAWESSGGEGEKRKDLVSRALALLVDATGETMTLQLWGMVASEENLRKLREETRSTISAPRPRGELGELGKLKSSPSGEPGRRLAVFAFTRLRPDFSYSCQALVLNTTEGSEIRQLPPQSPAVRAFEQSSTCEVPCERPVMERAVVNPKQQDLTLASNFRSWGVAQRALPHGDDAALWSSPRDFASVEELENLEYFCGVAILPRVTVRQVEAFRSIGGVAVPDAHMRDPRSQDLELYSTLVLHIGDPWNQYRERNSARGVEATARVVVAGEALRRLLGGIVALDLLMLPPTRGDGAAPLKDDDDESGSRGQAAGVRVIESLLEGLQSGGFEGEEFSVHLACVANADDNGKLLPGGTSYRLLKMMPTTFSSASD